MVRLHSQLENLLENLNLDTQWNSSSGTQENIRLSADEDKENQHDSATSEIQVLTEYAKGVQEMKPMEVDKNKNIQNEIVRRMDLPKEGEAIFKV